jgi:uncharacterized damage-inducible protein DinB
MDLLDHYRLMARYNAWMNGNLYAAAAQLSDEDRKRDRGAFFKSIHGTLNHILVGDSLWMGRFERNPFDWRGHAQELHADFDDLRRAREAMDARITAFVAGLAREWLDAPFEYLRLSGAPVRVDGFAALTHFFNHQTHHRGQATTLLMQAGIDPGATDIVAMPGIQVA